MDIGLQGDGISGAARWIRALRKADARRTIAGGAPAFNITSPPIPAFPREGGRGLREATVDREG